MNPTTRVAKKALAIAALLTLSSVAPFATAAGDCDYLSRDERRLCKREEAAERASDARATRAERRAQAEADRQASEGRRRSTQIESAVAANPQRKREFARPPSKNRGSFGPEDSSNVRLNKLGAIEWVNSDDPSYVRLRAEVERSFPLWARSKALHLASEAFVVSPGRFAGELDVAFATKYPAGGKINQTIQAQIVAGELCLGLAKSQYSHIRYFPCDDVPSSQAAADNLYSAEIARQTQRVKDDEREKQESAAVIAGSRTRSPGSPLNEEDAACLKEFTESYQEYVKGQCIAETFRMPNGTPGPSWCTKYGPGHMATRHRNYEKNACSRPISFRDQCGSTIWGSYTVQPGARFDRQLGPPCGRVY